jgi:hypothetical protein
VDQLAGTVTLIADGVVLEALITVPVRRSSSER